MRKIAASLLMLSLLPASAVVLAAGQMKPGLWEMTVKSDAFKNMPKIPPAQMEQMRNSTYDFKGSAGGQPVSQHQETSGKWLGADCGNVKPVSDLKLNK
jgi:hypothetical protein